MRLKLAIVVGLTLVSQMAAAQSVSVSSSTVTTIAKSNGNRSMLCVQNNGTNPVYFSTFSSSATVTGGNVLVSSAAWSQPVCIAFRGALFGTAAPGASADVRYLETQKEGE